MQVRIISSKNTWEAFRNIHSPDALFQSWSWGEVLKSSSKNLWRLGIYKNKKLSAIAQVALVNAKRGRFLHVRHGPVIPPFIKGDQKKAQLVFEVLLERLRKVAKDNRALFIRINPLVAQSATRMHVLKNLEFIPSPIHAMDGEYCLVIDIAKDEQSLFRSFRKSTRQEIRKAQKRGVTIISSLHTKDFETFAELYEKTSKRQGFVKHTGLKQEFEIFKKDNNIQVFLALDKNTVLAGALIVYLKNQAIYHHGASIQSKVSGSHVIQWSALLDAKHRGLSEYNMWGIAPEGAKNHPWQGLTRFKKGFGGTPREFIHAHDLPLTPLYVIPKTIELIRKKRKGY